MLCLWIPALLGHYIITPLLEHVKDENADMLKRHISWHVGEAPVTHFLIGSHCEVAGSVQDDAHHRASLLCMVVCVHNMHHHCQFLCIVMHVDCTLHIEVARLCQC